VKGCEVYEGGEAIVEAKVSMLIVEAVEHGLRHPTYVHFAWRRIAVRRQAQRLAGLLLVRDSEQLHPHLFVIARFGEGLLGVYRH
jgi:hypothetical protein